MENHRFVLTTDYVAVILAPHWADVLVHTCERLLRSELAYCIKVFYIYNVSS